MADLWGPEERRALLNLFRHIDDNNSGFISARNLLKFCNDYGYDIGAPKSKEIVDTHSGGTGKMNFDHFCTAIAVSLTKIKAVFVLIALFQELDTTNTGRITALDLHRIVLQTGADVTHQEIQEIMNKCDTDGSGGISFKEFVQALINLLRLR